MVKKESDFKEIAMLRGKKVNAAVLLRLFPQSFIKYIWLEGPTILKQTTNSLAGQLSRKFSKF